MTNYDLQTEELIKAIDKEYQEIVDAIRKGDRNEICKTNGLFQTVKSDFPSLSLMDDQYITLMLKDQAILVPVKRQYR